MKHWGADVLAAIAMITGFILKEYLATSFIILMLASGQTLEQFAAAKASSVLQTLAKRMPQCAHRKVKNRIENVSLELINIGDIVIIYPNEPCPVDGLVIDGNGSMDESYLTGEPYLISKAPGSNVLSGAINGSQVLTVQVSKLLADSRYSSIVKVLEDAENKRPQMRRLADNIGAIFAPIAICIALLAWWLSSESIRFLSVLVIATPCPLLIAVPITIISAISKAAKQAIIIKDPLLLEQLPLCKTAIFDKTGTLTYGRPTLTNIQCFANYKAQEVLRICASLERYSKHPLSNAILNAAEEQKLSLFEPEHISEVPGMGLTGTVMSHRITITGRKKIATSIELPANVSGLECVLLIDDSLAAIFHFQDAPRPESHSFLKHLKPFHQFSKLLLVSGDRSSEVNYIAKKLEIKHVYAEQSPEQKLSIVRNEVGKAPTVFMGDGINDAPALTAATVGIAFGEYSDVTAASAGAVIMENTFSKVDTLFHLCQQTRTIALQSALGGMLFSIMGMYFAATGHIAPVEGAILQEIIDVLAIMNSLRLTWGKNIQIDLPS